MRFRQMKDCQSIELQRESVWKETSQTGLNQTKDKT